MQGHRGRVVVPVLVGLALLVVSALPAVAQEATPHLVGATPPAARPTGTLAEVTLGPTPGRPARDLSSLPGARPSRARGRRTTSRRPTAPS